MIVTASTDTAHSHLRCPIDRLIARCRIKWRKRGMRGGMMEEGEQGDPSPGGGVSRSKTDPGYVGGNLPLKWSLKTRTMSYEVYLIPSFSQLSLKFHIPWTKFLDPCNLQSRAGELSGKMETAVASSHRPQRCSAMPIANHTGSTVKPKKCRSDLTSHSVGVCPPVYFPGREDHAECLLKSSSLVLFLCTELFPHTEHTSV